MLPHEYEIDQQRCDQQDAIAEQLYIDGFSDAMDGKLTECEDEPYKLGYTQGTAQLHSNHIANHFYCDYNLYNDFNCLEDNGEF